MSGNSGRNDTPVMSSPNPKRFKRSKRSLLAPYVEKTSETNSVLPVPAVEADFSAISEPVVDTNDAIADAQPDPRMDDSLAEDIVDDQIEPVSVSDNSVQVDDRSDTVPIVSFKLLNEPSRTYSEKFLRLIVKADFNFNHNLMDLKEIPPINEEIDSAFEAALLSLIKGVKPDSKVSVSLDNDKLVKNIYLPPVNVSYFKKENFLNSISIVYQSNREFILDGTLKVSVYIIDKLKGAGRTANIPQTYEDIRQKKTSIIKIDNDDVACGLRALFVGKTYIDLCPELETTSEWSRFIKNQTYYDARVTAGARQIAMQFNLSMNEVLTIDDIVLKIQPLWTDMYQIFVVDGTSGELLYKGPNDCIKHIYLLWSKNPENSYGHFDVIKKIWLLFNKRKWCSTCYKFFQTTARHHCPKGCYVCRSPQRCIEDYTKCVCDECNRTFFNQTCYDTHINNKLCKELLFCPNCEVNYRVEKNHAHECDVYLCRDCKEHSSVIPHRCFLKTLSAEKLTVEDEVPKIINVFDIESMLVKNGNKEDHQPNLVCSMTICDGCVNEKLNDPSFNCVFCGLFNHKFQGPRCVSEFNTHICDFLAQKAHSMGGHVLSIAHNFSGYDGAFIFKELLDQNMQNLKPILNGSKLMKLDVGNVRYLDSLLFFQLSLSKLPSAFGFPDLTKGFFPHYLNIYENQRMPDRPINEINEQSYGINNTSESNVKLFREWYSSQVNAGAIFQFWPELEKYCKNDAFILLQAVIRLKKYFKELTNLDPVTRCFTLPSVGLEDFRTHHLEEESIIVTPVNGFNSKRNKSAKETAYIDYQEFKVFKETLVRDYRYGNYRADGMLDKQYTKNGITYDKVALFFDGCYWHGCTDCNKGETVAQKEIRENREEYFKKRNVLLIVEKECQFDHFLARTQDQEAKRFIKQRISLHQYINKNDLHVYPRKALHGGRTNNIKFYAKSNENESLNYFDFTSLYPWVLKNHSFPMKAPITVYDHKLDSGHSIKDYHGLISAKVLPPKQLRFPVLSYNCNDKLMFPLCRTCAVEQNHDECKHTVKERQFTGVFTSAELNKAVDRGYKIKAVYEITHFMDWSDTVFKDYINKWYKVKAEASGWPKNANTEEERDDWIAEMERKEGIIIEKEKVVFNPGMRFIAKLMLNSLWGKLAQRPNRPQTRVVKTYAELWQLFNDDRLEILGEYTIGDMILVNYNFKNDSLASAGQTCSVIASFVTAYARLKLLDEVEKIENDNPGSVIYFDTDSIVFSSKPGCYKPLVVNYLGEMTDEIVEEYGVGSELTAFYTTGPKSYCTKVLKKKSDGEYEFVYKMKSKGLTQNYGAKDVLNPVTIIKHSVMKAMNKDCESVLVPQCQFRRHPKQGFSVTTDHIQKVFRNTSNKRRIIGNDTVPFGYHTYKHNDWLKISDVCKKGSNHFSMSCGDVTCRNCVKRTRKCHDEDCNNPECVRDYHLHR